MFEINTIFSKNNRITVHDAKSLVQSGQTVKMVLPLWIGLKEDAEWMFPIEPLLSISGKNLTTRRLVKKTSEGLTGTIKERCKEDDLTINIQGSLVHDDLYTYPSDQVALLISYMKHRKSLFVKNELLCLLGINKIVIESYSLPFSKGENVQNFIIDALSDDDDDEYGLNLH